MRKIVFNEWLGAAGGFLDGRVTWQLMAGFWPTADADADADASLSTPSLSTPSTKFAAIWRDMPKIVYSRTLTDAAWNTTVVPEVVPADVERLKQQPGGDLVVGGADHQDLRQRRRPPPPQKARPYKRPAR
ncbi:MAG TPA: hypothetical protein VGH27_30330 [Streptosporangiaceae bacterium]|jgi:dihydrofolate reductase